MKRETIALAIMVAIAAMAVACEAHASASGEETSLQGQIEKYIAYNKSIKTLTVTQRVVMESALSTLPAPCCSKYTAATCCCSCNLARTIWGLSKHLIVEQNYSAGEVRKSVSDWIQAVNPDGFSGKACFNGGCRRPFGSDGCGGMSTSKIAF